MNLGGVLHLGTRHLRRNGAKTTLLVAAFSLVWLLPAGLALFVRAAEAQLRARAEGTTLLLGQAGSPLELVFNGLYFTKPRIAPLAYGEVEAVAEGGLAEAIPLYARFSAGGRRIVGTSLDYFDFRGLEVAEGRGLARLGECVVGAAAARALGLAPGGSIISTPETLFDIAGVYPLKMRVVGVLASAGTPDDEALFVDLRTAWIIEGLGHGHEDAEVLGEEARLPGRGGDRAESGEAEKAGPVSLNASVTHYNEITEENEDSFHFHGEPTDFPVGGAIVLPGDAKAQAILKGRYGKPGGPQLVSPADEMDDLFATVFSVQALVLRLLVAIGLATLAMGALVFLLSYRLRREEFLHLRHLGADPVTLRALVAFEAVFVVAASLLVAALGLAALRLLAPLLVRGMLG
jgi:putative ABC transport system permease protein